MMLLKRYGQRRSRWFVCCGLAMFAWSCVALAQRAYVSGTPIVAYDVSGATPAALGNIVTGYTVLDLAVSPDGGTLYALAAQDNAGYLLVLNPRATDASSNPPAAILGKVAVGSAPFGGMALSADGKTAYVANSGEGSVYVVNVSGTPTVSTDIGLCPGTDGIALSADGSIAYVACRNAAAIGIIGTAGPSATTIPAASGGSQLALCAGTVCESIPGNARIDEISAGVSIALPSAASGLAISPSGTTLYATLFRGMGTIGGFVPIDLSTHPASVGGAIDVGRNPTGVTLSVDGKTAYIANYDAAPGASGGTVSVVDTTAGTVTATLAAGVNPTQVALGAEPPPLATSKTTLILSPSTTFIGQQVTASVVVSFALAGLTNTPGVPSGSVVVSDATDSAAQCTITLTPSSGQTGAGSCALTFSTPGAHTVTANYSGDALYAPSSGTAAETVVPVGLSLGFSPTTVPAGATADLTVTLSNASTSDVHVTTLTVTAPAGLTGLTVLSNDCSGSVGLTPTQIILSGGVIGLSSTCSFVVGTTSTTPATYTFSVAAGDMQTSDGNNTSASSAAFTVVSALAPTVSLQFSPASIKAGGISTLTMTLSNANATPLLLSGLGNTLPSGVTVANPANATTDCPDAAVTASPGSNSIEVSNAASGLVTSTIPPGGCTASVDVTATSAGAYVDTLPAGALQAQTTSPPDSVFVGFNDNSTAPANATLNVTARAITVGTTARAPALSRTGWCVLAAAFLLIGLLRRTAARATQRGG